MDLAVFLEKRRKPRVEAREEGRMPKRVAQWKCLGLTRFQEPPRRARREARSLNQLRLHSRMVPARSLTP
jgi:hypothetical protein